MRTIFDIAYKYRYLTTYCNFIVVAVAVCNHKRKVFLLFITETSTNKPTAQSLKSKDTYNNKAVKTWNYTWPIVSVSVEVLSRPGRTRQYAYSRHPLQYVSCNVAQRYTSMNSYCAMYSHRYTIWLNILITTCILLKMLKLGRLQLRLQVGTIILQ